MTFQEAISSVLSNATNFQGRSRRSEYWFWFLGVIAAQLVVGIIYSVSHTLGIILYVVVFLGVIVPTIAVGIRRLHDTDRSGWWLLLNLIPLGGIVVLVFFLMEGTAGPNKYGASPKALA